MIALLAALLLPPSMTLKVGQAWFATESITLTDLGDPSSVIEEDHYHLDFVVIEKRSDAYVVDVSRLQTESVVEGHVVPALAGGKAEVKREIWKFGGDLEFVLGDDHRETERLQLERPRHAPIEGLRAVATAMTGGPGLTDPSLIDWKGRRTESPNDKVEAWDISFNERSRKNPMSGTERLSRSRATGLPESMDIRIDNAMPRGGTFPVTMHVVYRAVAK